jgi:hypothetical protein
MSRNRNTVGHDGIGKLVIANEHLALGRYPDRLAALFTQLLYGYQSVASNVVQNQGVAGVVNPVTIRAASEQLEHGPRSDAMNAPHPEHFSPKSMMYRSGRGGATFGGSLLSGLSSLSPTFHGNPASGGAGAAPVYNSV